MLLREIIIVYSENHTKLINILLAKCRVLLMLKGAVCIITTVGL
jgi:hypothetical protein